MKLPLPLALAASWAEHGHICLTCSYVQSSISITFIWSPTRKASDTLSGQIRTLGPGGQLAGLVQAERRVTFQGRFLAAAAPLQAEPLAAPTLLTLVPKQPFLPQGPRAKGTPLPVPAAPFWNCGDRQSRLLGRGWRQLSAPPQVSLLWPKIFSVPLARSLWSGFLSDLSAGQE